MKVCPVCGSEYGEEAAFCSRDRSPLRPAGGARSQGLVGQLVGERYQVERRLGEGGMGEVYFARHVLMGRPCALKVMSESLSKDPDAVTRFNREATSASSISHPNVCTVYDFGLTADGLVYLAMEYVEGRTLSELLESGGPMPVERAAALIEQCAAGLAAAHELGIVHRDLKPENIMVQAGRERETVKLVDFGIAKAAEGPAGQRVTRTGFVVGTPEYMSPEQLSGDPLNSRSDQYSLGLVFYRLLTGQLPFEGSSLQETLVKRLTDPPRPLAVTRPELHFPAGLQAIMDRALARDPVERYPDVLEFARAVTAVVAADARATRRIETGAAGSIPTTRTAPAVRAQRRVRLAAGALLVIGLGGMAWGALQLAGRQDGAPGPDTLQAAVPSPPPPAPGPVETLAVKVTTTPPPAPAPAPAPASATNSEEDTSEVNPNAALNGTEEVRRREIRRAVMLLGLQRLSNVRRARAAQLLAQVALEAGDRDSARALFRRAWELDPRPVYRSQLALLGDTVRP